MNSYFFYWVRFLEIEKNENYYKIKRKKTKIFTIKRNEKMFIIYIRNYYTKIKKTFGPLYWNLIPEKKTS